MRRHLTVVVVGSLAASSVSSIGRAEERALVSVDYSAPAGCPRSDAFAGELVVRAPRARVVAPAPSVRALVVRVRAHKGAFAGRVTLREPDGIETERAVTGESCADVVTGLALIAAVAVDPSAAASANAKAAAAGSPPPASSGGSAAASPLASSAAAAPAEPPREDAGAEEKRAEEKRAEEKRAEEKRAAEQPSAPPESSSSSSSASSSWSASAGVHGGGVGGVAPPVLFVVPIFVEAARESGSLLSPSARLRVERTGSGTTSAGGASAQFTWTAASLDLCPLLFASGRLGARPCVRMEGGTLEASGVDVQPTRTGVRPWFSAGAVVRGRVVVAGPLFLELELSADLAFVRDRFFVEPSETVYRAPLVGWAGTGGAGVTFR